MIHWGVLNLPKLPLIRRWLKQFLPHGQTSLSDTKNIVLYTNARGVGIGVPGLIQKSI